jgi:lambda family phage portal protein
MARRGGLFGFAGAVLLRAAAAVSWVATEIAGIGGGYQVLDPRRKIIPRGMVLRSLSANELATMSLPQLRALCRKLERDNPTARAVVEGLVAQVVGTGIALEPDHGDPVLNQRLRVVWQDFIASCDISGRRSIYDLEAQAFREVVVAGEFLWRTPVLPERASAGQVPLVVLPLECEWIAADVPAPADQALTMAAGVELDRWGRPMAYHLASPEAALHRSPERVAASEVIHDFERRRALQNRGEPWLVPVIERIWQEGDLVDAELRSAINCAAMALVITSEMHDAPDTTELGTTEDPAQRIGVGSVARLYPGEDVKAFSHNRPAQQIADFRRSLRGDIAACCRLDQRWLDRNYKEVGSYSSMRGANIDNDKLLAPIREWFGHATIGSLYVRALPYLCILAGVVMPKRIAYRLIPDGQAYVDPLKDAQAAAAAIGAGLSTWEAEIGKRGGDYKAVWKQLALERSEAKELGLVLDLSGTNAPAADSTVAGDQGSDAEGGKPIDPKATNHAA